MRAHSRLISGSGRLFWYSGDVGVTDNGTNLSLWADRANANNLTPAVGEPEVATENSLASVFFQDNTANLYAESGTLSPTTESPFTIYAVFRPTLEGGMAVGGDMGTVVALTNAGDTVYLSLDVEHVVTGDGESQAQHAYWFRVSSDDGSLLYQEQWDETVNTPAYDAVCDSVTKLRLACIVVNGASSALYIDDMTTAAASGTLGGGTAMDLLRIGATASSASNLGGEVCEVFAEPGAADATTRGTRKTYLQRWGTF